MFRPAPLALTVTALLTAGCANHPWSTKDYQPATKDSVVDHYADGIQNGPALDNRLRQGNQPMRLNLDEDDREALVDFMETLTDETLLADPKFSNPFPN